jgi:hypothetical protein
MKLKAVAAAFKKHNRFKLYTTARGEQWIDDGMAAYKLEGLPELTPDGILTMFDIPPDKRAGWDVEQIEPPDDGIAFRDSYESEEVAEMLPLRFDYMNDVICLFTCGNDIYGVYETHIKPFLPLDMYLTFNARYLVENGTVVLAVKTGFFINALIRPLNLFGNDRFNELFSNVATRGGRMRRIIEQNRDEAAEAVRKLVEADEENDE